MVVSMSEREFSRLRVLMDIDSGRLRIGDAAQLLNISLRQVLRLRRDFRAHGAASLASKRRGRPRNNKLPAAVRELTMAIVKERYADFGPTLAVEKLRENHACLVSRETLRKWMIEDGLWIDRKHRLPPVHQPRHRRERVGELVQIDGSRHYWFENRGPEVTLIVYIDDATSRIQHAAHRPHDGRQLLGDVFAWKEERTLTHNLTVHYDKVLFMLEPNEITRPLARQRLMIVDYPDGRIAIRHKGLDLPYRTFDKLQKINQAAIVENKRLGEVLAYIAARQETQTEGRSKKAPRRRGQAERHMFKVS
ncbi:helix-turn-helix domain-containing protein [Methylocystis suflitae]|uniref:helix-turn-helix domain-containing protein n=1 Tax=Methylocystis suflitae TaxID=2951405 RepID=UPI00210CFD77|nr:helix-turn-helix domain-containing protein [Methylocystis suflitae]MCQ4191470.1 helix-turn-helix domain-containing protein [Methylocystis suflitae]